MLDQEKASAQNLYINFQQHNARTPPFLNKFDLIIMLYEGAFPLMETDEMNFQIHQNAPNALLPIGKLIFTTLNGLFPLFHSMKAFLESETKEGNATYGDNSFILMTFRDQNTTYVKTILGS